jgi:hypothetical protein
MNMMNQAPQMPQQENPHKELITTLTSINAKINDGEGSSTLKTILAYLKMNKFEDAVAVTDTDFDKLTQYDPTGHFKKFLKKRDLKDKELRLCNKKLPYQLIREHILFQM